MIRRTGLRATIASCLAVSLWLSMALAVLRVPAPTAGESLRVEQGVEHFAAHLSGRQVAPDLAPRVRWPDRSTGPSTLALIRDADVATSVVVVDDASESSPVSSLRPRRLAFRYDAIAPPTAL